MRYGYKCAKHGEFEANRPMAEAGCPAFCPQCGESCARYYGYQPMNIFLPKRFTDKHCTHFDYLPVPSDYDSRAEYLKDTKDLEPYRGGTDKRKLLPKVAPPRKDVLEAPAVKEHIKKHKEKLFQK